MNRPNSRHIKYLGALHLALDEHKINALASSLANTRPFFSKANYDSPEKRSKATNKSKCATHQMIPLKKGQEQWTSPNVRHIKYLGALLNMLNEHKINTTAGDLTNTWSFFSKAIKYLGTWPIVLIKNKIKASTGDLAHD